MTGIHGIDGRRAVDWRPILAAARELCEVADSSATPLGGALGRLLDAVPPDVLRTRCPDHAPPEEIR